MKLCDDSVWVIRELLFGSELNIDTRSFEEM